MSSPFSLSTSSSKGLESNTDQKPSFMPVSNLFNAPSTSSPLAAAPPRTAAPAVPPGQEKATAANMQIVQAIQECCRNIAKKLEEAAERIRSHDQGVKSDANNIEKLEKEVMELSRKHDHLSTLVEQVCMSFAVLALPMNHVLLFGDAARVRPLECCDPHPVPAAERPRAGGGVASTSAT
mmetsp:Transcript_11433/g.26121  ORF Transcript_11433/g.26121 Transcript_11433/m.26121 type:complete len:180 (-) Transcript_11433:89-628(-)